MQPQKQKEKRSKRRVFFIAKKDSAIFDAIKNGTKRVETRAGTPRNRLVCAGDIAVFLCNKKRIEKRITRVVHCKTIPALLRRYAARRINPHAKRGGDLRAMYDSFPGYREKITRYGILAFELE